MDNNKFSELYKGSSSYFTGQPFDNGLSKLEGTEKEKMASPKKIEKRKNGIKENLCRFFGANKNVRITFDSKCRQSILYECRVVGCPSKENKIEQHFVRWKHKWSQLEAKMHKSFCTRLFKYLTLVQKKNVMTPKICILCNTFYDRIDHHLSSEHKLEKSSQKYLDTKSLCTVQTEEFFHCQYDKTQYKYLTLRVFTFKKGEKKRPLWWFS